MKYKLIIILIIVTIGLGLLYTKLLSNTDKQSDFDINQLNSLGEIYYILYNQNSNEHKFMQKTDTGTVKELFSSFPTFNQIKFSPNNKYISWIDGTTFLLKIFDRETNTINNSTITAYQHEWDPTSNLIITMSSDCSEKRLGTNPRFKLIATNPGITTYSFNVININNPSETKFIGCYDKYPGTVGLSQFGWFDTSIAWIEHIKGISTINYTIDKEILYAGDSHNALIYSPFSGGKNYRLETIPRYDTNTTKISTDINLPILDVINLKTQLFMSADYIPITTDLFDNIYYFHNNCVYKYNIQSEDSTELTCRPDLNYFPNISTTPNNTTLISYNNDHYYCDENGCQQFSLEFDNPDIVVSEIFILPKL